MHSSEVLLILALTIAMLPTLVARYWRCRHRFGHPFSGHVRCMRCARRFRILDGPDGAWRISRQPAADPS